MSYVLESKKEVERLEEQSKTELYDYRKELSDFMSYADEPILDAGSGSGIVSRYLAEQKSGAKVIGCEFSADRIEGARKLGSHLKNLEFVEGSLLNLPFSSGYFGSAVCRFVIEHLSPSDQRKALSEIYRCLKPGGRLCLIDVDGMYHNLFPMPDSTAEFLVELNKSKIVDLQIGRQLPSLLIQAGFSDISWKIETMEFSGQKLDTETRLMRDRIEIAMPSITRLLGSEKKATRFRDDFLSAMNQPGSVLFYNKFIVTGRKEGLKVVSQL